MQKPIKISTFSDHCKYDQTCPKYTNLDLFCDHCMYSKLHAEKVPISKEQILQTFVHKSLDIFRPLQVLSNMSKVHKFRPFLTTVDMVNQMRKPIKI